MRELAIRLGIGCGILMALALFMSLSLIFSPNTVAQASLLADHNSSTHSPFVMSASLASSDDGLITGSLEQDSAAPVVVIKYSSGWSVNRASKADLLKP